MNQRSIDTSYHYSISDLRTGKTTVAEQEQLMKSLEAKEEFEECAGISKALKEYRKTKMFSNREVI